MAEKSLKSYDPLAYYVTTIGQLDKEVVQAYKTRDNAKKQQLFAVGEKLQLDIFIYVNNDWHGAVLLVPCGNDDPFAEMFDEDPSKIPAVLMCYVYELVYDDIKLRMYKIKRRIELFRDIQKRIKKSYYIGRYKGVPRKALDYAAMQAAPHRYEALLNDCVSFAMEYCHAMLSHCSNGLEIEAEVEANIKKASASGFSIERLSRQNYFSGLIGNVSFGGVDVSSYLGGRNIWFVVVFVVLFLGVYNVLITIFILWITNNLK